MIKDNNIQAFFELLKAGLFPIHGEGQFPVHDEGFRANGSIFSDVDWGKVYQLAQEQSVQGLVLQGIEELKAKGIELGVPKVMLLQWIGEAQVIEQRNKDMNAFIAKLITKLREADIYALLVKGQGIAQCYEKPLWRCSGDVDLLLSKNIYEKAKAFIMPMGVLTEPEEAGKKHLAMQVEQWAVELHGTLHVGLSANVDRMLDKVQHDIFYGGQVRSWMNEQTQVFLPAANEDVVYVFAHILQHFYKGGIGLRQICDWCRLLWTYKDSLSYEMLESRIRKMGVMSEWKAFGALAIEYLGFPKDSMPLLDVRSKKEDGRCEIDANLRKKADKICKFILEVGNFGHNRDNSYFQKHSYLVQKSISAWRRVKDLCRHATIFPVNSVRFFFGIMYNGIVSTLRGE
jgi:hypothetical protein